MANHLIRAGDNPDLTKERKACNFNTEELASFMYGSREKIERRRAISRMVDSDPGLANPVPLAFLSREKMFEAETQKITHLMSKIDVMVDRNNAEDVEHLNFEVFGADGYPLSLHNYGFIPFIKGQAHDEMVAEILPRAMSLDVIGAYAQTELGHGTNLRDLETTATYDQRTEEFVIHTPTRTATKWWPGSMGKMANHAAVTAQLIIDGTNYGPHIFLVQLRSQIDHRPLPGVTVGDIGSKLGANCVDNGFLALDRVRIPRKRMFMKHAQVAADGTYTPPLHPKLSYGGMVYIRAHMIYMQALNLCSAVTIAIRYSAVRRQGRIEKDLPEVQVLDYQTQQYRLFPQIARAYAHFFAGQEVHALYDKTMAELEQGKADLLPDLHALTSGLKSVTTFSNSLAIEQCRMACGGHGYSQASGLPKLFSMVVAGCTYEGDNTVMLQQTARYLVNCVKRVSRGQSLGYSVQFLERKTEGRSRIGIEGGGLENEIKALFASFEHVARRLAMNAATELEKRIRAGDSSEKAWHGVTVEMNRAARVYTRLFIAQCFHRRIVSSPPSLRPVLNDLLSLYLHYECVDMAHYLLHDGHCTGEQIDYLKKRLYEDLGKIRPNAVSLVDSFDQSDRLLCSVLGRRDGNVYEALYQWAKASELNYTDVIPAFDHMKVMMEENRAKISSQKKMANHLIRAGDNPDLTKERKSGNFNTEDLACYLYGSKEKVERRREMSRMVDSDKELVNKVPLEFLSREKRIEVQAFKTRKLMSKIFDMADVTNHQEMEYLICEIFGADGFPLQIHNVAFVPVIQGQGHAELVDEILPRAMNLEIIGTYAQTEMGHGSNLRELETTATYDKQTEEFVLHTPTRSSMKWWPGNLGKMANYTTVTAQLVIDGKNYGPHNFVLQLRSEIDHKPLPGITVGDIGTKMGVNGIDNGFLALDRVRIPRKRMLMKHAKVAPDGTYTAPIHSKLSYGSMVYVRTHMLNFQTTNLISAVTIATRYSAVRRQGRIENNKQEVQVLDYQTQQHRIFPQIARAYAHFFVGQEVLDLYNKTMVGLNKGETDLLPDLHALTSGLKSVTSYSNSMAVEQCRMGCGGHGYSEASGLPKLYCLLVAGCTYEGENMVMLQQAARYLVKSVKRASRDEPLTYSVEYLGRKTEGRSRVGMHEGDSVKEIEALLKSLEHIARRLAVHASNALEQRIKLGETKERAWNGVTVEMNRAARVYTRLFIAQCFHRRVVSSPPSLRPVLNDILSLYLHYECVDMASHLLHDGHCTGEQIDHLKKRLYEDLAKIRPNAVSLVDSFDQSDRLLNSMLGKRDGNAYEALYQWAKASELNYTDVIPAFDHMKAMMEENRAKM